MPIDTTVLHSLDAQRGHSLLPSPTELAGLPRLYETDGIEFRDKTIHLRYFAGSSAQWLIAEADPDSLLLFGHCDLGLGFPEWGYVDLHELASLKARSPQGFPIYAERDLTFRPRLFSDLT